MSSNDNWGGRIRTSDLPINSRDSQGTDPVEAPAVRASAESESGSNLCHGVPTDTLGSLPLSLPLPGEVIEAQRALADEWLEGHGDAAESIRQRVNAAFVALAREREAWYQTAAEAQRSSDWFAGLLDVVGKMFGDAARTTDDGSLQDSILRAKVPELVQAAVTSAEVDAARVRVMRRMLDTILRYEREHAAFTRNAVRAGVAEAIRRVMQAAPVDAAVTAEANGGDGGDLLQAAMIAADPSLEPVAKLMDALFAQMPRDPRSN